MKRKRGYAFTPALARHRIAQRTVEDGDCLIWTGNIDVHGYPRLNIGGELLLVHRLNKALTDGGTYTGMHVHHKCHRKACVRPDHLEILTKGQHTAEHMTHAVCKRGHSMEDAYPRPDGRGRQCRPCIRLRTRRRKELLEAAKQVGIA